ncbi:Uncharacterised protein [Vibrio cholerae]|nr:Uncharacterised protein [Vibrio cholerae]CSI31242.1 Uncharacterised protein [Vibrio cholerae]
MPELMGRISPCPLVFCPTCIHVRGQISLFQLKLHFTLEDGNLV